MPADYPKAVELTAAAGTHVLFADMLEVAELRNAHLVVNEARKHPANPVIGTGELGAWDSLQATPWQGTVMWDAEDDSFKAWYMGLDAAESGRQIPRMGYAQSPDGVAWEKPALGIHAYNGSTANNLLVEIAPNKANGPVLKDPGESDPARRYKFLCFDAHHDREFWFAPDGLHFTRTGQPNVWNERTPDGERYHLPDGRVWFDAHQILYDPQDPDPDRHYKLYGQMSARRGDWSIRKGGVMFGPTPYAWTRSALNPIIDPDDGEEFQIHFISVLPWKGYYFMLYEFGWLESLRGSYVADIRLAVSRDGETFRRVDPHQPVIRRGAKHEWDGGFLVTSSDVVAHDGRFWLYYAGQPDNWTKWPGENRGGWPGSAGSIYPSQTGLATLPQDGLTNVESLDGEMPGVITTVSVRSATPPARLELSVSQALPGRSWVDVAVVGADGEPLLGYGRDECEHVLRDGAQQPVRWADNHVLPADITEFRLQFWTYGGVKLHGFTFA